MHPEEQELIIATLDSQYNCNLISFKYLSLSIFNTVLNSQGSTVKYVHIKLYSHSIRPANACDGNAALLPSTFLIWRNFRG